MASSGLIRALGIAAWIAAARIAQADETHVDHVELDSARSHATFGVKVMWLVGVQIATPILLATILIDVTTRL